jgi:hypothetical protein
MYLRKLASTTDTESKIDADIEAIKDKLTEVIPSDSARRALMLSPALIGAAADGEGKPLKGALKGLGLTAGGYAGFKGGKALAKQLENAAFMQHLTPEQQGWARLAAIAAGTGLGAKLGWSGVGSLL